jgi:hypothetical protein
MHTVWTIWQTRIDLKFGKNGTVQRSLHTDLDQEILSHFQQGDKNLLTQDKFLIQQYSAASLYNSTIAAKQSWLDSINSAREAFAMANPIPPASTQRSIRDYFTV